MSTSDKVFKKLPGVLSFSRGLVISDAVLFNEDAAGQRTPVHVVRHGIRGTQNINGADGATASTGKRQEISNIQTTDSAKLAPDAVAMVAAFDIRFLDIRNSLASCAPGPKDETTEVKALRDSISGFLERATISDGLKEIARRYGRNVANARWLWRNRLIASQIKVTVQVGRESLEFDALRVPVNHFKDYSEQEIRLGQFILGGLAEGLLDTLHVEARVSFGAQGAIEVFPSQNYLEDKPKGFARSLYCIGEKERASRTDSMRIMGQAAIRDQKLSNAIRTIDTWYPDFELVGKPIAIEPNGANLEAQTFFRDKKTSAFDMVARLNLIDPASNDGMFVTASLIRGGVFSGGKKE